MRYGGMDCDNIHREKTGNAEKSPLEGSPTRPRCADRLHQLNDHMHVNWSASHACRMSWILIRLSCFE